MNSFSFWALFTFSVGISVRREASDATADDEGIALAIAEETDAADERLAANRKLTEKVNKASFWIRPIVRTDQLKGKQAVVAPAAPAKKYWAAGSGHDIWPVLLLIRSF